MLIKTTFCADSDSTKKNMYFSSVKILITSIDLPSVNGRRTQVKSEIRGDIADDFSHPSVAIIKTVSINGSVENTQEHLLTWDEWTAMILNLDRLGVRSLRSTPESKYGVHLRDGNVTSVKWSDDTGSYDLTFRALGMDKELDVLYQPLKTAVDIIVVPER
jgi:hypothetical protein